MYENTKNPGDSSPIRDVSHLFDRNKMVIEILGALMTRKAQYLAKNPNHSFVAKEYQELQWVILEVDHIVKALMSHYQSLSGHYLVAKYEYQALKYSLPTNRPLYSFSREVIAFKSLMSTGKLPEKSVPLAIHEKVHRMEIRLKKTSCL